VITPITIEFEVNYLVIDTTLVDDMAKRLDEASLNFEKLDTFENYDLFKRKQT